MTLYGSSEYSCSQRVLVFVMAFCLESDLANAWFGDIPIKHSQSRWYALGATIKALQYFLASYGGIGRILVFIFQVIESFNYSW